MDELVSKNLYEFSSKIISDSGRNHEQGRPPHDVMNRLQPWQTYQTVLGKGEILQGVDHTQQAVMGFQAQIQKNRKE